MYFFAVTTHLGSELFEIDWGCLLFLLNPPRAVHSWTLINLGDGLPLVASLSLLKAKVTLWRLRYNFVTFNKERTTESGRLMASSWWEGLLSNPEAGCSDLCTPFLHALPVACMASSLISQSQLRIPCCFRKPDWNLHFPSGQTRLCCMSLKLIYVIYFQFLVSIFLIFPTEMEYILCFSQVSPK